MSILLDKKEILKALNEIDSRFQDVVYQSDKRIVKATGKKIADAIESMTADGWWLEDIVKAIRKECE